MWVLLGNLLKFQLIAIKLKHNVRHLQGEGKAGNCLKKVAKRV